MNSKIETFISFCISRQKVTYDKNGKKQYSIRFEPILFHFMLLCQIHNEHLYF